ncbi:class D beta-lactamase [Pedobacter caeni]|uniref:Beta-lactamase class D n=1 Tax=Pedobacter caeni TaxID=288992 RepID=A0A1M4YV23_9SPHI|nr:class D beta-lactamase [Pedobacter caeni]SHF09623.1 beta-lactamase class D [Pedobacter caeni]
MKIYIPLCLLFVLSGLSSFKLKKPEETKDFKRFYDQYKVQGSFILYDQKNDKYTCYNQEQASTPFTPASTFKICNSLISLETAAVADENVVSKWDGKERPMPAWNADTDMKNAFKNSTVWFYQELARKVGEEKMKFWLEKLNYGNADISGGIDGFWLRGGLRITPAAQIEFLRKLQQNKLPLSSRSMDIVKKMMMVKDSAGVVLRAKTGSGKQDNLTIGWYVGYVTTKDNVYYFSNCIQTENRGADFANARQDIAYHILEELNILKK